MQDLREHSHFLPKISNIFLNPMMQGLTIVKLGIGIVCDDKRRFLKGKSWPQEVLIAVLAPSGDPSKDESG